MKKIGYFFLCFVPFIASVCLQFIASVPVMGICFLQICISNLFSGRKVPFDVVLTQFYTTFSSQNYVMMISIVFAISGLLLFGFWYTKQFHGNLRIPVQSFSKPVLVLGIICLVPGLQILSSLLTTFFASIFPKWMEYYIELMENAGFSSSSPSLLLILYAVILGPIEEELTFRGVILSSGKKALPLWAANIFQAILFGIFHMNLIQGIYAFCIGLFLGYVCERGGSIWLSIFLHILFNFWGTCVSSQSALLENPLVSILYFLLSIPIGILGLILFHKNTSGKNVKNSPEFSDM